MSFLKYLLPLASLFLMSANPAKASVNAEAQITCLANNAYHEARGQRPDGQRAVMHVVMNRTKDKRFGSTTPCGVIQQPGQFTWVKHPFRVREPELYAKIHELARLVYIGALKDNTNGAFYFRNVRVRGKCRQTARFEQHIFCR